MNDNAQIIIYLQKVDINQKSNGSWQIIMVCFYTKIKR